MEWSNNHLYIPKVSTKYNNRAVVWSAMNWGIEEQVQEEEVDKTIRSSYTTMRRPTHSSLEYGFKQRGKWREQMCAKNTQCPLRLPAFSGMP